jgi:hypothetical protein
MSQTHGGRGFGQRVKSRSLLAKRVNSRVVMKIIKIIVNTSKSITVFERKADENGC